MIRSVARKLIGYLPRPFYEFIWYRYGKYLLDKEPARACVTDALRSRSGFDRAAILSEASPFGADFEDCHAEIVRAVGSDGLQQAISPGERRALYLLARALAPKRVLEVGTHIAMSTCYLAKALEANGGGAITTVDILDVNAAEGPWRSVGLPRRPADTLEGLGVRDVVSFLTMPATRYFERAEGKFDLVFLDGDHAARAVYGEIADALRLLNPGGVIVLHDYYPGGRRLFRAFDTLFGPYLAVERLRRENPSLAIVPLGPLPWVTLPGSNETSLAMLLRA